MTKTEIDKKIWRLQNIRLILEPGHIAKSRQVLVKKETPKGAEKYTHNDYTTKGVGTWKK